MYSVSCRLTVAHVHGGGDAEAQGEQVAEGDAPPQPLTQPRLLLFLKVNIF